MLIFKNKKKSRITLKSTQVNSALGHINVKVGINELLCFKNAGAQISMFFTSNE